MSCGNPGRCCNGPDCATGVGACKCQCDGNTWHSDNLCTPGACWFVEGEVYKCELLNGCECEYRGGEFSGPGSSCPDSGSGPPPPDPPPPDPPDPGPITVYCCEPTNGVCYSGPGYCEPGQGQYWSPEQCNRSCRQSGPRPDPQPPPDPDQPCDPPCGPCQDCVNNTCVNRCPPSQCCNGVCCAAGQVCVNGACISPCSGSCTAQWIFRNFDGGFSYRVITGSNCTAGCSCTPPDPGPQPTNNADGPVVSTPCLSNAFP